MKFVVLKMISGEEVIGRYQETLTDSGDEMVINGPLIIAIDESRGSVMLVPYMVTTARNPNANIPIKKSAIAALNWEVPEPFEKAYIQQTSGIDLSSKLARS